MFMPLMRRVVPALMVLVALLLIAAWSAHPVNAANDQAGQCEGYDVFTKVDTDDGSIVLPEGTEFCIHASNNNTGRLVADGVTTLAGYIEQSGILNNGGQIPNVSNYVVYGQASSTETATPSPDPIESMPTCSDCDPTPTATPVPTQSETPSTQPTFEPTQTLAPNAYPDGAGQPPLPNTATNMPSQTGILLILLGLLLIVNGAYLLIRLWVTRDSQVQRGGRRNTFSDR